ISHAFAETPGIETADNGDPIQKSSSYFKHHVANLAAAAGAGIVSTPPLGQEAFEIAQWASQSSAAAALQPSAARFAGGGGSPCLAGAGKPGPRRDMARRRPALAGRYGESGFGGEPRNDRRTAQTDGWYRKSAGNGGSATRKGFPCLRGVDETEAAHRRRRAELARPFGGARLLAAERERELCLCGHANRLRLAHHSNECPATIRRGCKIPYRP